MQGVRSQVLRRRNYGVQCGAADTALTSTTAVAISDSTVEATVKPRVCNHPAIRPGSPSPVLSSPMQRIVIETEKFAGAQHQAYQEVILAPAA